MKRLVTLIVVILFVSSTQGYAQSQASKIQALFILKFVQYVSWPQTQKQTVVGIVGKSDVFTELEERLKAAPANISVKRISAEEAGTVDVVFIPSKENGAMSTIASKSNGKPVLIISESNLSGKGSGISFIEVDGRMNFMIDKNAIESRGMKVSATLLSLGKQA